MAEGFISFVSECGDALCPLTFLAFQAPSSVFNFSKNKVGTALLYEESIRGFPGLVRQRSKEVDMMETG